MVSERQSGTQIEDDLDYCIELMMSEPCGAHHLRGVVLTPLR